MASSKNAATNEWLKCEASSVYFIDTYIKIYDATTGDWTPFKLWPEQVRTLQALENNRLVIILKARQLGMTWLVLAYVLWRMLFKPICTSLLFSRRDDEASHLLDRLSGMYSRIPSVITNGVTLPIANAVSIDNAHIWKLSNESVSYGFPTTAGDSYTASIAVVDEADLILDLGALMNAVKPTIDGGGRMILLSRSDKKRPNSTFKRMFRAAHAKKSPWIAVFLPWFVRPDRNQEWYEEQRADVMSRTGNLDDLHQQYPATPGEALDPPTVDKRFPLLWVKRNFVEEIPLLDDEYEGPMLSDLYVYKQPEAGRRYVIGADPAEGNPTSDDSSATVMDADNGGVAAELVGKIQPTQFAVGIALLSEWYDFAKVLPERNNHGHAVIGWLTENSTIEIIKGWDGKPGWYSTARGKADMWVEVAEALRVDSVTIRSQDMYDQVASIDGHSLSAPEGDHDDRAVSFGLCVIARGSIELSTNGGIHV